MGGRGKREEKRVRKIGARKTEDNTAGFEEEEDRQEGDREDRERERKCDWQNGKEN